MSRTYNSSDVFQPTFFPDHTYVNRLIDGRETYESRLRKALKTKGVLTLITGPSKSGKTVLYHSVIPADQIIEISGSHIRTPDDFWTQIAEKREIPLETETTLAKNKENTFSGEAGGKTGVPLVVDVNFKGSAGHRQGKSEAVKEKQPRSKNHMVEFLIAHEPLS